MMQHLPHIVTFNSISMPLDAKQLSLAIRRDDTASGRALFITSMLARVSQLTQLSLCWESTEDGDIRALASSLCHLPQLTSFSIDGDGVRDEACRALAASLHHVPQLTALMIRWHESVRNDAVRVLVDAIVRYLPRIVTFNEHAAPTSDSRVHVVKRGDVAAMLFLAGTLHRAPQLTELHVGPCNAGVGDGHRVKAVNRALVNAIVQHLPRLTKFNGLALPSSPADAALDYHQLHVREALLVAAFLHRAPNLTSLNLSDCRTSNSVNSRRFCNA